MPRSAISLKFLAKVFLLLLLVAAAVAAYFWHSMHAPYGNIPPEGTFVEVPHGASQRSVARLLKQAGIIRSPVAFEIYARRHPRRSLQAGEYFFDHPLSGKDVYWKLANGDVFEQPFTVREGETIFDIAHDLETAKYMPAEEFLTAAQNPKLILDIAPNAKTLEGFVDKTVADRVSLVATDELQSYNRIGRKRPHGSVNHTQGEYVRGEIHTQNIDSFWSLIKRGIMGSFHHVSKAYLPLYLNEFSFRHNNRENADMFSTVVAGS